MKVIKNISVICSLVFVFTFSIFGFSNISNEFFQDVFASSLNDELCKASGGNIKNAGMALESETLDYCMNLDPKSCAEINGVWNECIEPDCSDVTKPCPMVLCIKEDVCVLHDYELSQQKIQQQENQNKMIILIISICATIAIGLTYIFVRKKKIKNLQP